jgi:hypothetical protein
VTAYEARPNLKSDSLSLSLGNPSRSTRITFRIRILHLFGGICKKPQYGFDAQHDVWKLLQREAPTRTATGGYSWTLKPGAGVRYLQVWATDSARTISSFPYQTFINLLPDSADVEQRHTDVYRFALSAGERFTAQVAILDGDADLYVRGPSGDSTMRWVSNGRGNSEQVSFIAPVNGVYQVEVRGHRQATYQLTVTHGPLAPQALSAPARANASTSVVVDDKEISNAPAISLDSTPTFTSPGNTIIFLPLVTR